MGVFKVHNSRNQSIFTFDINYCTEIIVLKAILVKLGYVDEGDKNRKFLHDKTKIGTHSISIDIDKKVYYENYVSVYDYYGGSSGPTINPIPEYIKESIYKDEIY